MATSDIVINEKKISFLFKGTDREANLLRKIFLNDIPVLCMEHMKIFCNESVMFDEYICDRLRLVPLVNVHLKNMGSHSETLFTLEKENNTNENIPVYSHDFLPENSDEKIRFVPNIIITYLPPGASLEMEMLPQLGYARDHAKWSTVARVVFQEKNTKEYVFHLETTGQYPPKKLLKKALEIYSQK